MSAYRGKVALVTGGGSGIGRALCAALRAKGAYVVAADLDVGRAEEAGDEGVGLDVGDFEAFRGVVDGLVERRGRLDLLFNNAGVGLAGEVRDLGVEDWERQIRVNLWGVIHGVHAAYPHMLRQGSGHIVNTSSGAGLLPRPGMAPYAATKHAVVGLSTSLRAEAAGLGVRVSVVCPGYIGTEIMAKTRYVGLDGAALQASIPIRPMSPRACAEVVLRGVRRNRAVIPVTGLTWLEWWVYRLSPRVGVALACWRGAQMRALRR